MGYNRAGAGAPMRVVELFATLPMYLLGGSQKLPRAGRIRWRTAERKLNGD